MIGAIIGDVVGSRFEFANIKTKDFELFTDECKFTDDTVMSIAVARSLMVHKKSGVDLIKCLVGNMQLYGRRYPDAGYGWKFAKWIKTNYPKPYKSFGNGSAMRVSACGFIADNIDEALDLAEKTAIVTHNHEEGVKGAQATAVAVYLAQNGADKEEIKKIIENRFYLLDQTLDDIRPDYEFDVSCQGSVPQAIQAFLESENFEDAIRNAVSIGGDSDTIACITGGIAEAYYGIPEDIKTKGLSYLTNDLKEVVDEFEEFSKRSKLQSN